MYSMDINTMGSQSVHSILWHNWQNRPEDDLSIVKTCSIIITLSNKAIVLTYTIWCCITLQAHGDASIQTSDYILLGCDITDFDRLMPTFWRDLLPTSSWYPPKWRHLSTKIHSVTAQKTVSSNLNIHCHENLNSLLFWLMWQFCTVETVNQVHYL